jgi:hypothetical protein
MSTFFKALLAKIEAAAIKDLVGAMVIACLLFTLVSVGYLLVDRDTKLQAAEKELIGTKQAYEQLGKNAAKLETDYTSAKDLAAKAQALFGAELVKNQSLLKQIKAVQSVTLTTKQPAVTEKAKEVVPNLYYQEIAYLNGPPVGSVAFNTSSGMATWKLFDHHVVVDSAITVDPKTGKASVVSKGYYILDDTSSQEPNWLGRQFPLAVTSGEIQYTPGSITGSEPTDHWMWVKHLNVGVFGGASVVGGFNWGAHADMTFFGYGATRNDLDWKFLGVGLNANTKYVDVDVVPAYWRVPVPLTSNIYLGPGFGFGTSGVEPFFVLGGSL